ncbi:hypothetical protein FXW78_49145 [Rhodococcus opacus]|nr:hypothetical protein [Rhodococcus opacus]
MTPVPRGDRRSRRPLPQRRRRHRGGHDRLRRRAELGREPRPTSRRRGSGSSAPCRPRITRPADRAR